MRIEDYENPTTDPYAPRPDASKRVAAKHRASATQPGRPTHDTEPIEPIKSLSRYVPFGIGALVLIMLMIGAASYQLASLPAAKPLQIETAPAQAFVPPSQAAQEPTSAPIAQNPSTDMVNAYAAPDGALLGPIETTRQITPVAHYGSGWIQADVEGSGRVWLRAADVPGVALIGPDLAPVAQQQQVGQGLTVDQSGGGSPNEWTPPEATPELVTATPAQPTATVVWPTSEPVEHRDDDFKKPDIRGTCQFVGCLGQNAVDLSRAQACHTLFWQYGNVDSETIPEPDYSAVRACIWEGLYK